MKKLLSILMFLLIPFISIARYSDLELAYEKGYHDEDIELNMRTTKKPSNDLFISFLIMGVLMLFCCITGDMPKGLKVYHFLLIWVVISFVAYLFM